MDNLERLHSTHRKIEDTVSGKVEACSLWDGVVCLTTKDSYLFIYKENDLSSQSKSYRICETEGSLKHVRYLSAYNQVFMTSETKVIIFDHSSQTTHIEDAINRRIAAVSWNPLQTAVLIIDEDYNIYLLTYSNFSFILRNTANIKKQVPIPLNVGWGIQNAQYQGPNRKKIKEDKQSAEVRLVEDDRPPIISWRGNGEQFVVNYCVSGVRYIKTFSYELEPLYESKEYFNLQQPTSFMGRGQRIACCAVKENKNELIIFEKNCKLKEVYLLPDVVGKIKKLLYHPHATILAVLSTDGDSCCYLNIYLFSNNIWYLKQQLYYPPEQTVFDFDWIGIHETVFTTCKIAVVTSRNIEYHVFRFIVNRSFTSAVIGVVNGRTLQLYDYDQNISPPPMFTLSYTHSTPINLVYFHPTEPYGILIDAKLQALVFLLRDSKVKVVAESGVLNLQSRSKFVGVRWSPENEVMILIENDKKIDTKTESEDFTIRIRSETILNDLKLRYSDTGDFTPYKLLNQNQQDFIYLSKHSLTIDDSTIDFEFALNNNKEFYINDKVTCSGVTSFFVYKKFIIFTHVTSKLYCIRLKDYFFKYYSSKSDLDLSKLFERGIEQNARIVHCNNALPPQIILQLPRGNVETVTCKLIAIDIIEDMLSKNHWHSVISLLRAERINWNVLIDLNPLRFLEHVEEFIKASDNCNLLTAIVTEFNPDENCFETLYKNYFEVRKESIWPIKLHIIEEILKYLISTDCVNNLGVITIIQQKLISLKSALKSVKDVFEADPDGHEQVCGEAIKQILIQEHFQNVLKNCYTFFNLRFLALVFRNSNEDPRVYSPELDNLHNMEEIERRFEMSSKAGEFVSAVKYLLRMNKYDEEYVTNFIIKNKLEAAAYNSIGVSHKHTKVITKAYAKYLSIEGKHVKAAFILKRAGLLREALVEYKIALEYREVMAIMTALNYDVEKGKAILYDLAEKLLKSKRIEEAIFLVEQSGGDYKKAITMLIDCKAFRKAICLAQSYGATREIDENIRPALAQYGSVLGEKLKEYQSNFEEFTTRLKVIREERKLKFSNAANGLYEGEEDELYSDAGSTIYSSHSSRATSRSRGSTLSSKNRRKEERKKVDLRPGGYYEDIALIRALHIMYVEVFELGKDLQDVYLISELGNFGLNDNLHIVLKKLQDSMNSKIPEIWPEVFVNPPFSPDQEVLAITLNRSAIDPKFAIPPSASELDQSWFLDVFD